MQLLLREPMAIRSGRAPSVGRGLFRTTSSGALGRDGGSATPRTTRASATATRTARLPITTFASNSPREGSKPKKWERGVGPKAEIPARDCTAERTRWLAAFFV